MSPAHKTLPLLALGVVFLPAIGCKGKMDVDPTVQRQKSELSEIYDMYAHFLKSQDRAPKQLSDLTKKEYEGPFLVGHQALASGKYLVVWGVNSKDPGTVLAYEKDAPTRGGAVLMADRTVKTMSAEEFKAAKR